jgi:hypothetical protein
VLFFAITVLSKDVKAFSRRGYARRYGSVPSRPRPLDTITLPEQAPILAAPDRQRLTFLPSTSSYGSLVPLEQVNIPEGPASVLAVPDNRQRSFGRASLHQGYRVPAALETITGARPLETITLPEQVTTPLFAAPEGQSPVFAVPDHRQRSFDQALHQGYRVPSALETITGARPLETITLPEQVSPPLSAPDQRFAQAVIPASFYGYGSYGAVPLDQAHRPLETITLPEQVAPPLIAAPDQRLAQAVIPASFYGFGSYGVVPLEQVNIPEGQAPVFAVPDRQRSFVQAFNPEQAQVDFAVPNHRQGSLLYHYGYQDENSAKQEYRSNDGVTRGFYSYMDPNGQLQQVNYISDAVQGYRILGGTPVLQDTPEVAQAKIVFEKAYQAALARNSV